MLKKILLTGGGTAGHIWPVIAIGEALKSNARLNILYVGSNSGPEKKIAKNFQIPFKGILVGKWRNYFSFLNFWDTLKTFFGIIQSFFILIFFKPNVIFAKGGYVTFPILFWAKIFKTPVVIHESDLIMGKANRWAANFAKKICLGFPVKYYSGLNLPMAKIVYTGTPVRRDFFGKVPVSRERPMILVTGGSQGSTTINQKVMEILPELVKNYDIYHLSGSKDYPKLKEKFTQPNYHLIGFTEDVADLMRNADLIISRAGANTLAEISALGKPSILIPLPSAHLNHQEANAKVFENQNAAVVVSEKNLTGSAFLSIINRLMEEESLRQLLGHHAQEFSRKEATSEIIDILFEMGEKNGE